MTVCPFCKKAVVNPNGGPCPSCGKVDPRGAQPAPAAAAGEDEWDAIEHGAGGGGSTGASSYGGGSFRGLDDDDDNAPAISLELDAPPAKRAGGSGEHMAVRPPGGSGEHQAVRPGGSGEHRAVRPPGGSGEHRAVRPPGGSGEHQAVRPGGSGEHRAVAQPMPPQAMAQQSSQNLAPPPSQPAIQQPQHAPPPPPDAAFMIARYPDPPEKVWQTPVYAMKVLFRQFELRQDIASLRRKRSPDVPLYERALKTHDGKNFAIGLVITCAAFTVATFIFFLPVILRFVRDPE